jgi:hypothetical protein
VIGQFDAMEIDDEVVAQMVKKDWPEEEVLKADGFRDSPGLDSLLRPIMSSDDVEDPDDDEATASKPR